MNGAWFLLVVLLVCLLVGMWRDAFGRPSRQTSRPPISSDRYLRAQRRARRRALVARARSRFVTQEV